MTLGESDHLDWLALLRVRSGRVGKRGDRYAYRGQPFGISGEVPWEERLTTQLPT